MNNFLNWFFSGRREPQIFWTVKFVILDDAHFGIGGENVDRTATIEYECVMTEAHMNILAAKGYIRVISKKNQQLI